MSVNLPPRTRSEWFANHHFISETDPQSILDICNLMENELGLHSDAADRGTIDHLTALLNNLYAEYAPPDDREGHYYLKEGRAQEFANLYRDFEKRYNLLQEKSDKIFFYLGKSTNKNANEDVIIRNIFNYLHQRMAEISVKRYLYVSLFQQIEFRAYNRIFRSAINHFAIAPLKRVKDFFRGKTVVSLAVVFVGVGTVRLISENADSTFITGAASILWSALPYLAFATCAIIFDRKFRLGEQVAQHQVTQHNYASPPNSPPR